MNMLLKKSKNELARIIVLLFALVVALSLLTFSKFITIEKSVIDSSAYTGPIDRQPPVNIDPYQNEPSVSVVPTLILTPSRAPEKKPTRCIMFKNWKICTPRI